MSHKAMKQNSILVFAAVAVLAIVLFLAGRAQFEKDAMPAATPTPALAPTATPAATTPPVPTAIAGTYHLWVHFIDVGQGDSGLVIASNGTHNVSMLVDGGKRGAGKDVVGFLEAHGVHELKFIILTNSDEDHIGGFLEVVKSIPVGQAIESGATKDTQTYRNLTRLLAEKNVTRRNVTTGENESLFEGVSLLFLNPSKETAASSYSVNDKSVATKIVIGSTCFIFPGDSELRAEKQIVASGLDLHCQVLKAGHHGSRTSSSVEFLQAVLPEVAIISAGANNSYGHPHNETLQRLAAVNATIYRTDRDGSILIESNGTGYMVATEK